MGTEWHSELQKVTKCHEDCHRGWNSKAGFTGDVSERLQTALALLGLLLKRHSGSEFFGQHLYSETKSEKSLMEERE